MEWATLPLRRFAQFSGRSRRKEYWMFFLLTLASFIVASIIDNAAGLADEEYGVGPVYGLVALGLFIPSLAVSVRRLHDTGRSGWWLLLSLIPLGALVLLYFYASNGEAGPNRFGPDPKAGERTAPA
jgi:uncharacterized membrane protein YhaH (DUF805 family)